MLPQFGFQAFACWQRSAGNYFKWKRWWWSMCEWGAVGELLGRGAEEGCVCLENEALQSIHSLAGKMGEVYVRTLTFTISLIVSSREKAILHTQVAAPSLTSPIKACKNKHIEILFFVFSGEETDSIYIWVHVRTEIKATAVTPTELLKQVLHVKLLLVFYISFCIFSLGGVKHFWKMAPSSELCALAGFYLQRVLFPLR